MALDNSRVLLELLYNISRELATAVDLQTVLDRVLFLSIKNVGAERGTLIVLDEQQNPMAAAILYRDQFLEYDIVQLQDTIDQGLAGWVLRTREAALVPDTSVDPRWLRKADDSERQTGAKSAICVPLTHRDHLAGILTIVHPDPNTFTQEHLALLQSIADQAGIAVYNARLYDSLQAATRRYRELFEDSIDPILLTDLHGRVLEANRQAYRVTGYEVGQITGSLVTGLHVADMERLGQQFENVTAERTVSYESDLLIPDGQKVPVEVYVRQVLLDKGEVSLQWTMRDISARKALNSLQEDLSAMIYHDLRSPLANIVSSLDMMDTLLPEDNNPMLRSVFSIATRSTERMQRLINSLLDINRLEAGQPIANRKPVEVPGLLHEVVEAIQPVIESKQQKVNINLPEGFPIINVDVDMLRRVLINLLENAAKFTPVEGNMELGGDVVEGGVRLWVRDSGPGISPEAQPYIFEKFVRLQADRFPKGFGLGLAFCRLAVQAHGGRIWVESQPGNGSCFIFTLPVDEAQNRGE